MKVLITYFTVTKNTETIAKSIYDEVSSQNHNVDLKKIDEVTIDSLHSYDLVFVGSACHDADLAKPAKLLLKNFPESQKFKGSQRNKELHENWASKCIKTFQQVSKTKKIDFKGYFSCMGVPSSAIANFIHETIIKNENEWEEYMEEVVKHPNQTDMQDARKFARDILTRI